MAVESQIIPVALGQGLDTKTDPKQIQLGKKLVLQNCSFKNPGELDKRDGFQELPSLSNGIGISNFQNELIALDGSNLYSYSPDLASQISKGALIPTSLAVKSIVRNTNGQTGPDMAYDPVTGLQCFVWIDSTNIPSASTGTSTIKYSILDSTTGTNITTGSVSSTANNPTLIRAKVVLFQNNFVIIYYDSLSTASLRYKLISTATPTIIGSIVVIDTAISTAIPAFDVSIVNGSIYIGYRESTTSIRFKSINSSFTLSSSYTVNVSNGIQTLCIRGDASNNIWCAYAEALGGPNIYVLVVNGALASTVLAPTELESVGSNGFATFNITMIVSGITATVYWEQTQVLSNAILTGTMTITGTAGGQEVLIYRMGLASKAFVYGGNTYFLGLYSGDFVANSTNIEVPTTIEPTYFLLNSQGAIIAKLAPSSAGTFYVSGLLPEVTFFTSTQIMIPYLLQDDLSSQNGNIFYKTGVQNATISFSPTNNLPKLVMGQNLHWGGGQLYAYDGNNLVEQGFHIYPENVSLSSLTSSGGGIGIGASTASVNQVQYSAIYEWQDNQGQLHRSATSVPLTITLLPNSSITEISFTGDTTANSMTISGVSSFTGIVVGQTLTDHTNSSNFPAGTYIVSINTSNSTMVVSSPAATAQTNDTFYIYDRCSIELTLPTLTATYKQGVSIVIYRTVNNGTIFYRVTSLTSLLYNSFAEEFIQYTDTLADAAIIGNEQLYTTGGELDNFNAPAISASTEYKNRFVYLSPENPFQFGYSKQVDQGVPVEFSSLFFTENIDQRVGFATAVAGMDDKLVIFGPHIKFYVVGDGPAPDGTQNDFTDATKIEGTTGTNNPASVLGIPNGVIYQDSIRGLYMLDRSLQEQYIGADVEAFNSIPVVSANLIPNSNKAAFTFANGTNLIYDYYVNQWETDIFPAGAIDSTIFQSDFTYIQANGLIMQQTPGAYTDNGALIPISFTTGWMSFAELSGFVRVWELQITETFYSPHVLTVNIYTDYSATPTTTEVITVNAALVPPIFRINLEVQKCTTVQVEITETQTGAPGQGLSLSALAFKVGMKKGPYKLPAAQTY